MKTIRNSVFETNSSSSHSLTINSGVLDQTYPLDNNGNVVINNGSGETEFGWQQEEYRDVGSKLIYAYIQADDVKRNNWLQMLDKVVLEYTGGGRIFWNLQEYNKYSGKLERCGYIDHQSSSCEGSNTQMFDSEENLKNFLFSSKSYITTDNDNR